MTGHEVILAELTITYGNSPPYVYKIASWEGYGVVCPDHITTNGSILTLITALPLWKPESHSGTSVLVRWEAKHPSMTKNLPTSALALWDALWVSYESVNPPSEYRTARHPQARERAKQILEHLVLSPTLSVQT